MAGFISFGAGSANRQWATANWVFFGLMDHVLSLADDDAVARQLTVGKAHQFVDLEELEDDDTDLFQRVIRALRSVCTQIIAGELPVYVNGIVLDQASQSLFRREVERLLDIIDM